MLIHQIETSLDGLAIYNLVKDQKYPFFLDSSLKHDNLGQYSFIGYDPFLVFESKGTAIKIRQGKNVLNLQGDPLLKIQEILKEHHQPNDTHLPFIGGAVGFFSYDLCHQLEKLPRTAIDDVDIPDCFLGFYDGVIVLDHKAQKVFVTALGIKDRATSTVEKLSQLINKGQIGQQQEQDIKTDFAVQFTSNFTKTDYLEAVRRVKAYIKEGDIYQANLTQRFHCKLPKSPQEIYKNLRAINPAPFAGIIDFGQGQILSSSPERFIKIKDRMIETRPIKGTRPRGENFEEDRQNREDLLTSEKDKAELLMIVDLERNDLGRICKTGTVRVPKLFELEEYATVYHLVATIEGELKDGVDVIDCLRATFPGGSITGAPKIRAMEIIDQLEPTQRNIYTGSMGYIGFDGNTDLNIIIRTIVCKNDQAFFQVGGGIVWDSQEELEYQETLHKGKALMEALRT